MVRKIKELAREVPLVVLPAHDKQSLQMLEETIVYKPTMLRWATESRKCKCAVLVCFWVGVDM
jgi:hypothetical protein